MSRARFWHHRPGVPAIGRCFCCFLQQNISQVSVVRLRLAGFSIGMRLRKQQRTWLFLAVFERARPAADRKCMAAGDYQFDSEIASVIPILAITSRAAQALGRLFATRLKRRLHVESGPSPRRIKVMGLPPFQTFTLTLERGGSIQSGHRFAGGGRPSKLTEDDVEAAKAMLANPVIGVTQIAPSRRARRRRSIDTFPPHQPRIPRALQNSVEPSRPPGCSRQGLQL
jgi:hypothetical protein